MDIPVQLPGTEGQNLVVRVGTLTMPKLVLNGQPLVKQNGSFRLRSNDGLAIMVKFKARGLDPIPHLMVGNRMVQLAPPLEWYQWAWLGVSLVLVLIGGAIGGLCAGLAVTINSRIFRMDYSEGMKYALTGLISAGAFITWFAIAESILATVGK